MTNEELKKKIIEIIQGVDFYDGLLYRYCIDIATADKLADALIAAGIGDVKKRNELKVELRSKIDYIHEQDEVIAYYKHRAEVAERALLTACVNLIKNEKANVNMELLVRVVYTNYLRKAKKELSEEGEDESISSM